MLKELKFRIRIGKHDHHLCSQGEQTVPSIVLCITSSSRGPGRLDEVERHRQTPHQDILTCTDSLEKTSVQSPSGELVGAGVGATELIIRRNMVTSIDTKK